MERLTERIDGYIKIKGCKSYYPTEERKGAPASNAIVRLAKYEDTGLMPDKITKFVVAGKWIEDTLESTIACPVCYAKWGMIDNCTETFAHCPNCGVRLE